jgi:hypothetical protein
MVFCHDINGLFKELKQEHNPSDWRLFIDSSQRKLKVVLNNGNSKTSIAIAQSVQLKETFNMKILVAKLQGNIHQWNCGDLKVLGVLMGKQGGFTEFCCFCLWDSRSTAKHYIKRDWEPRKTYEPGKDSVQHIPLVNPLKIFLPPL